MEFTNSKNNTQRKKRQGGKKGKKRYNNSLLQDQINIHKCLLSDINSWLLKMYYNNEPLDNGFVISKTKNKYGIGCGIRFGPNSKVKLASGNVYYNDAMYSRAPQKMDSYFRFDYVMKLNGGGLTLSSTRDNLTMERLHYAHSIAEKIGETYDFYFDENEHLFNAIKYEYNENTSFYRTTTLLVNKAIIVEENDKLPIMSVYHKIEGDGRYHIVGRVKPEDIHSLMENYRAHGYKKRHIIEDCSMEECFLLVNNAKYLRAGVDRIFRLTNNRIKTLVKKVKTK